MSNKGFTINKKIINEYLNFGDIFCDSANKVLNQTVNERRYILVYSYLARHSCELYLKYMIYNNFLKYTHKIESNSNILVNGNIEKVGIKHDLLELLIILEKQAINIKLPPRANIIKIEENIFIDVRSNIEKVMEIDNRNGTMFKYPLPENEKFNFGKNEVSEEIAGDLQFTNTYIVSHNANNKTYVEEKENDVFVVVKYLDKIITDLAKLIEIYRQSYEGSD